MDTKERIYSFKDLDVYRNSYNACLEVINKILPKLPASEKFDLVDQLSRSCKAIPRLIAEGYAKRHQKSGFQKYIDDAMAECNETIVGLEQIKDIYNIEVSLCEELIRIYDMTARQLFKLALAWDSFKNRRKTTPLDDSGGHTNSPRPSGAFTLVEVMVVVLLLTIFLGFGLTSGGAIRDQLAFFRNQQIVAAQVYKARALAIATLDKRNVCGYGVRFTGTSVDIHPLDKPNPDYDCTSGLVWGGSIDEYSKRLDDEGRATGGPVAFIAPIPTLRFDSGNSSSVLVRVHDVCGSVQINRFGQVSTASANCP